MVLTLRLYYLALLGSARALLSKRELSLQESKIVTKVVYRDIPAGGLPNLPTLPPATCAY